MLTNCFCETCLLVSSEPIGGSNSQFGCLFQQITVPSDRLADHRKNKFLFKALNIIVPLVISPIRLN